MMPGTNFPHGDLHGKDHEFPPGTKPTACQALCDKTAECHAWTFLKRGPGMSCCIKGPIASDGCPEPAEGMVSGAKVAGPAQCSAGGGGRHPPARSRAVPLFDETECVTLHASVYLSHRLVLPFQQLAVELYLL
jgi:hypothetical protein